MKEENGKKTIDEAQFEATCRSISVHENRPNKRRNRKPVLFPFFGVLRRNRRTVGETPFVSIQKGPAHHRLGLGDLHQQQRHVRLPDGAEWCDVPGWREGGREGGPGGGVRNWNSD